MGAEDRPRLPEGEDPVEASAAKTDAALFQFALPPLDGEALSLAEFYREGILDLLRVVRFYFRGQPVLVDAFAFHHRPEEMMAILSHEPLDGGGQ